MWGPRRWCRMFGWKRTQTSLRFNAIGLVQLCGKLGLLGFEAMLTISDQLTR